MNVRSLFMVELERMGETQVGKKTGTKQLANGATYSYDTHRIVANPPGGPTTAITADNARGMQALAVARKRVVMAEAANSAVQDQTLIARYGDYAAVAERAQTLQQLATTPDAGKAAVMAHQALTLDTGMAEPKQPDTQPQTVNHVYSADPELMAVLREVMRMRAGDSYAQAVDGDDGGIIDAG